MGFTQALFLDCYLADTYNYMWSPLKCLLKVTSLEYLY